MRSAYAKKDKSYYNRAAESFADRPGFRLPIRGTI